MALSAMMEEQAALEEEARVADAISTAVAVASQTMPGSSGADDLQGLPNGHVHLSEADASLGTSTGLGDLPLSQPQLQSQTQTDSLTPLPPTDPAASSFAPLTPQLGSQHSAPDPSAMFPPTPAGSLPSDAPGSAQAPAPAHAARASPTPTIAPWRAHNVDLDIMSHRLSTHRYHTPSMFLDDIAAIEDNASRLGDPDRQARVAGMAAEARLHVGGFDKRWDPEFERLRLRAEQRRAAKKARKEAREAAEAGEGAGEGPSIVVVPPEGAGPATTATASGAGTEPEASSLKRGREGEADAEDGEREGKRAREGEMEVDPPVSTSTAAEAADPAALTSAPTGDSVPVLPVAPAAPPNPPFVLPVAEVDALRADLVERTRHLSVDQLESLRAGLFDRLWRNRGDWDRSAVLGQMRDWVRTFVDRAEKRVGLSK